MPNLPFNSIFLNVFLHGPFGFLPIHANTYFMMNNWVGKKGRKNWNSLVIQNGFYAFCSWTKGLVTHRNVNGHVEQFFVYCSFFFKFNCVIFLLFPVIPSLNTFLSFHFTWMPFHFPFNHSNMQVCLKFPTWGQILFTLWRCHEYESKAWEKDKSRAYKRWLLSPEKCEEGCRFFVIPIALEPFCAQTLDKVIFISFHFIYCFY